MPETRDEKFLRLARDLPVARKAVEDCEAKVQAATLGLDAARKAQKAAEDALRQVEQRVLEGTSALTEPPAPLRVPTPPLVPAPPKARSA